MPVGDKLSSSIPRVMTVTILVSPMRCFKKHPYPHWAILVKIMSVGHPATPDTPPLHRESLSNWVSGWRLRTQRTKTCIKTKSIWGICNVPWHLSLFKHSPGLEGWVSRQERRLLSQRAWGGFPAPMFSCSQTRVTLAPKNLKPWSPREGACICVNTHTPTVRGHIDRKRQSNCKGFLNKYVTT